MRILIVEDESAIADVERAYLERDGYSVDIAPDGLKALEMFDKEEYDLLTFAVSSALKMAEPLVFQDSAVFMLHILCSSKTLWYSMPEMF